jgi:hypothetical protein
MSAGVPAVESAIESAVASCPGVSVGMSVDVSSAAVLGYVRRVTPAQLVDDVVR